MIEKNHTCSECEPRCKCLTCYEIHFIFKEKQTDRSRDTSTLSLTLDWKAQIVVEVNDIPALLGTRVSSMCCCSHWNAGKNKTLRPVCSKNDYQNRPLPTAKQQYRGFERDQIHSATWAAGHQGVIMRMGQHWWATETGFWKEATSTSQRCNKFQMQVSEGDFFLWISWGFFAYVVL